MIEFLLTTRNSVELKQRHEKFLYWQINILGWHPFVETMYVSVGSRPSYLLIKIAELYGIWTILF